MDLMRFCAERLSRLFKNTINYIDTKICVGVLLWDNYYIS